MGDRYEHIFKELYEKRLINKDTAANSYDRVRLIQKKMNQGLPKKTSKINFTFNIGDSSPFLEDADSDAPKRIIRQKFEGIKLLQRGRRMSLPTQRQSHQQFHSVSDVPTAITSYLKKNKSLTQRAKPSLNIPTGLYHSKKFQIIKRAAPATAQQTHRNLQTKRTSTPSKNVLIGGCNLEQEAETYRKQFKQMEVQLERYNKEMKMRQSTITRSIASRAKMSREEKRGNASFRKESWVQKQSKQLAKKLSMSRGKDKQDNSELMPWAVLVPEYQYY